MESGTQPAVEPVVSLMSKNMAMMTMMKKRKETRRNQRILEIFQVNSGFHRFRGLKYPQLCGRVFQNVFLGWGEFGLILDLNKKVINIFNENSSGNTLDLD